MERKQKSTSQKYCRKALERAENKLMKLPNVVGLGVVRVDNKENGHRVAVYVSEMPKDEMGRKTFPKKLSVPESNIEVDIEILEIGEIELEESRGDDEPLLGTEPF